MRAPGRSNRSRGRRRGTAEDSGCRLRANASCGGSRRRLKGAPMRTCIRTNRTKRTRANQRSAGDERRRALTVPCVPRVPPRDQVAETGRTGETTNGRRSGKRNSGVGDIPYRIRYACQVWHGCVEVKNVQFGVVGAPRRGRWAIWCICWREGSKGGWHGNHGSVARPHPS